MFNIETDEIFKNFPNRTNKLNRLQNIPLKDVWYQQYLIEYKSFDLTPDFRLYGYEESIKWNNYLKKYFPDCSKRFWQIADTGQGDQWFLALEDEKVYFYDHDYGMEYDEAGFKKMNINFRQFVHFGCLLRELEYYIFDKEIVKETLREPFVKAVNKIEDGLFGNYPYSAYFK